MKIIIAGSRNFYDLSIVMLSCKKSGWFDKKSEIEIVSGGARGVDKCGEDFANILGLTPTIFEADWDLHQNFAGPIRNSMMADYADALIAIRLGGIHSRGTTDMINKMIKLNKKVFLTDIKPNSIEYKFLPEDNKTIEIPNI